MTVQELIEILETMPQKRPVIADSVEITEVVIRDEIYCTEEGIYDDGIIVKLI